MYPFLVNSLYIFSCSTSDCNSISTLYSSPILSDISLTSGSYLSSSAVILTAGSSGTAEFFGIELYETYTQIPKLNYTDFYMALLSARGVA